MYIPGTENKTEHRPDARHHGQGEKENMAKSVGGLCLTVETLKNSLSEYGSHDVGLTQLI